MTRKITNLIVKTGLLCAVVNYIYHMIVQWINGTELLTRILGFASIIILPIAIYIGLRRIQVARSRKLTFLTSWSYGVIISFIAGLGIAILSQLSFFLEPEPMDHFRHYWEAMIIRNTLFWYLFLGAIYSVIIHFIVSRKSKTQ